MELFESLVLIVHVLAALAIIGLVLIQQGKGADMGSGFGGGSSATVFGSSGAGNFLTRTTTIIAITFFLTSFGLAFFAKQKSEAVVNLGIPQVEQEGVNREFLLPELEEGAGAEVREEVPDIEEEDEIPALQDTEIPVR